MLPGFFVVLSAFRFAQKSPRVRKTHRLQKVKRPPQLAAAFMAFRFAQIEVRRIKELTDKPFGVNIMIMSSKAVKE